MDASPICDKITPPLSVSIHEHGAATATPHAPMSCRAHHERDDAHIQDETPGPNERTNDQTGGSAPLEVAQAATDKAGAPQATQATPTQRTTTQRMSERSAASNGIEQAIDTRDDTTTTLFSDATTAGLSACFERLQVRTRASFDGIADTRQEPVGRTRLFRVASDPALRCVPCDVRRRVPGDGEMANGR